MKYMIALLVLSVANLAYGADTYKEFYNKIESGQKGVLVINPDKLPSGTVTFLIEHTYDMHKNVGVANFAGEVSGVYDCYKENGKLMMNLRVPSVVVTYPNYVFPLIRSACQNGRCPK